MAKVIEAEVVKTKTIRAKAGTIYMLYGWYGTCWQGYGEFETLIEAQGEEKDLSLPSHIVEISLPAI